MLMHVDEELIGNAIFKGDNKQPIIAASQVWNIVNSLTALSDWVGAPPPEADKLARLEHLGSWIDHVNAYGRPKQKARAAAWLRELADAIERKDVKP